MKNKRWVLLGGLILLIISMILPGVQAMAATTSAVSTITGTMPLVISNVQVTGITTNSATITWDTNGNANSQVVYNGTSSLLYSALVMHHSVTLTNLSPNTTYNCLIQSTITNFMTASASVAFTTLTSASSPTKIILASIPNPSDYGQTVYFGAAVVTTTLNRIPTGTVTYKDGGTVIGTSTLDKLGLTSFATSSLSTGSHNITAVYSGDSNFTTSTSNVIVQKVHYDSKITLSSTPNPSTVGQSVAFKVVVSGSSGTPTGTVVFRDGLTVLGSAPLISGTATYSTSALSAGSHPITASYSGDSTYSISLSNVIVQLVNAKAKATINLSSSLNPSDVGQSVKFTASVTPKTASGSITFYDGNISLGSANLSAGSASLSTNKLTVGNHNITAVYSGDSTYAGGTSNVVVQKVKGKTACTWPTKPTPISYGKPCTFSVQIGVQSPGSGNPTGSVTFYDGGKTLGTGSLSADGHATFSISSLSKGTHSITATYSGNDNLDGCSSSAVSQVVK